MGMRELECLISELRTVRIRKDSAPANFATIKHMASNILRSSKGKRSMRQKRHAAAWDDDCLFDMITA